jgi:glycosyltransferase involved in cell wall biosynthesis
MRVLQVNTFADRVGGAEVYLHDLSARLREAGHIVGLFASSSAASTSTPEARVVRRPDWDGGALLSDGPLESAFVEFCGEFKPDLIHLHNLHSFSVTLVARLAQLGIPTVQTIHDAGLLCANSWLVHGDGQVCEGGVGAKCAQHSCERNYPYDGRILTSTRLRADALRRTCEAWIAPSVFFQGLAARHGLEPVHRIAYSCSKVRPPRERRPSSKRILFAGRLVREKGIEFLIRAWPEVLSAHPDAELFIAGDGPVRESLVALCGDLGLDAARILRGKVPHAEIDGLMLESCALALPSIWVENSPLSCYESLQVGLPMIASSIGGLPDLVVPGRTGWQVPARDQQALSSAMISALDPAGPWMDLHRGCLEMAASLTPTRHFEAVLAVYRQAQERGTSHRLAIDTDLIASADGLLQQFSRVEGWALDMKKHIEYLEGIGRADQPVKSFARHMKFWLKSKRPQG